MNKIYLQIKKKQALTRSLLKTNVIFEIFINIIIDITCFVVRRHVKSYFEHNLALDLVNYIKVKAPLQTQYRYLILLFMCHLGAFIVQSFFEKMLYRT